VTAAVSRQLITLGMLTLDNADRLTHPLAVCTGHATARVSPSAVRRFLDAGGRIDGAACNGAWKAAALRRRRDGEVRIHRLPVLHALQQICVC